ncbi:uncharacterized protein LOC129801677 [Phlebotomus papatasi]|nr:uncharacterized protein LOC129801677 [Phlebotomus papatasi]
MEKYKLLSSVDPTKFPVVVKKKFSKLTLGNRSSNHQVSSMSKFTQRISYPPEEIDNEHKSFFLTDEGETDKYTLPDSPNGVHCSGLDSQISRQGTMSHENPEKESKDYIGYVKKIESGLRDLGIPPHKSFNTQNMPSLNISGNDCLSQELRKQIRASESDASILTISSTSSNEIDLNHKKITQSDCSKTPEVIILDESSENELPLKESFPAVSESTEKSLNSTIQQKLNAFFDKIPTQTEISLHYKSDNLLAENTFENTKENSMSYDDPVSLNETDNDEIKSGHEKYIPRDIEQKSQVVNISAKIKINIEIEEHEITSSFDESDHQYNDKNEEDDVPIVKKPIIEQKNQGKDDLGIDLEPEVQSILTEMYGDSWKTREVLNSIKKQKRRDPNDTITSK